MSLFSDRAFCKSILDLAQAYGPYEFWTQNLRPQHNPEATWRALLLVAALKDPLFAEPALELLDSPSSRVRAWACTALAELNYHQAEERLARLASDPAGRVRYRARVGLAELGVKQSSSRRILFHDLGEAPLVLVSEDDEASRNETAGVLEEAGYRVETAESEQETVEKALRFYPQAILTDNQKSTGMDHRQECDNLSGLNMTWDLCRCRGLNDSVIFMTDEAQIEAIFLWNGGDEYFRKPAQPQELVRRLQAYLYR